MSEKKEERQLSLFNNEKSEDLAAIVGAGIVMLLVIIL